MPLKGLIHSLVVLNITAITLLSKAIVERYKKLSLCNP